MNVRTRRIAWLPWKLIAELESGTRPRAAIGRRLSLIAVIASLATSFVLLLQYRDLGGPGDQLHYYEQAAQLLPFSDAAYGPMYYATIRVVHDVLLLDWFLVGKLVSWTSAAAFLALSYVMFGRLLGPEDRWLALALVAINPIFIGQSYSALTIMFGAVLLVAAIVLTVQAPPGRPLPWLLAGLVFGFACLTRFQSWGLLGGAILGALLLPTTRAAVRVRCASLLLAGALSLVLLWNGLLLWTQGYIPRNRNFLHLALAFGQFHSWWDLSELEKYGSMSGVLTSFWWAPIQIAIFAGKQLIKFPFALGYYLLFIAAGWLVPGAVVAVARRETHAPWLVAFAIGLFLTGIGSMDWLHYYVVFLPFLAILIVYAIRGLSQAVSPAVAVMSWLIIFGSTAVWSPAIVWSQFLDTNWPEFRAARQHMEAERDAHTIVSAAAGSFPHGTTLQFVRLNKIIGRGESNQLVSRLRQRHVTHLVVERHSHYWFPELEYLLDDSPANVPAGLQRELLIAKPQRLAIYRVLQADAGSVASR